MAKSGINRLSAPPAHASNPPRSKRWVAILLAGVLGVFLFAGTAAAILYSDLAGKVRNSVVDTSAIHDADPDNESSSNPKESPADSFAGRPVNILLMGTDARLGQSLVNPEDNDPTMRSDTTLVMHISADRQSVTIVSIPRDLWMLLPACNVADGTTYPSGWGQFNWAFSNGANDQSGPEAMPGAIACTEKTVEEMTGLQLDGYAVFDFNGFYSMIDALGGVNICLENEIYDPMYLDMSFPAGCQVMDPMTATQFARVRHTENAGGDGSDMERIGRQQKLVGAMIKQALSTNLLTDMPSLYQFVTSALTATVISPSLSDVNEDISLLSSVRNIDMANVRFVTMPVLTANFSVYRLVPEEPEASLLWQSLANDTPLPAGTIYQDLEGAFWEIGEDGVPIPNANPRTDDGIGSLSGWDVYRYSNATGTSVDDNVGWGTACYYGDQLFVSSDSNCYWEEPSDLRRISSTGESPSSQNSNMSEDQGG